MARNCRSFSWTFLLGALILGAGVVLLLDQQGILNADRVFNYFWPAVLIAGGIVTLSGSRGRGGDSARGYYRTYRHRVGADRIGSGNFDGSGDHRVGGASSKHDVSGNAGG